MLLSDIRKFIQSVREVTITDLTIKFNLDRDELETPLNILIEKGYIKKDKPLVNIGGGSKCSGCPMGCKPKEAESCSPLPNFTIYKWIKD